MQRLLSFPIKDSKVIQKLREASRAAPANRDAQIALALALIRAGCTYEAASI